MQPRALLAEYDRSDIRRAMSATGMIPPHAFIRGINAGYDLEVHVGQLLREFDGQDDLRLCLGRGDAERWLFMERLPWDSQFFSRGIARLNALLSPHGPIGLRADVSAGVSIIDAGLRLAQSRGIDYVFCTVGAADLPMIRSLAATGFELIETRCHYHMALAAPPLERYPTRLATPADVPSLAKAARESINHFDRFHADPAIPARDADRMMEKWVEASILEGFADATLVPDVVAPEAFCTAKYHREHWDGWGLRLAQPVLSAVSPVHRGWYVRIISELNEHLRSVGATHSFLITQVTNNAVIRCWEKLGYQFGKGEHVFRKLL